MTFQERWAEGPPDEPSALLTPDKVREALAMATDYDDTEYEVNGKWVRRLCRDYLTLWDRNRYNTDLLTAEIENLKDHIRFMELEE